MPATGHKFSAYGNLPWSESEDEWQQNELCVARVRSLRCRGEHSAADGVILPNLLREVDSILAELDGTPVGEAIREYEADGYACDRTRLRVTITQMQVWPDPPAAPGILPHTTRAPLLLRRTGRSLPPHWPSSSRATRGRPPS